MANFQVKSDLPIKTQQEIDRVLAIASAQRTTVEADFLTAIGDVIYNQKLLLNSDSQIVIAKGRTVPTGVAGFQTGAFFIKEDQTASMNPTYRNVGDATTSVWQQIEGSIALVSLTSAQIKALNTTPITLVSAQGAGKTVMVDEIFLKNTFNANAFAGSNALEFRYTDASGAKVTADIANTFINLSATGYASVKGVVTALTPVANAPIVVRVPTADPTAGDGAITGFVRYHVVTL